METTHKRIRVLRIIARMNVGGPAIQVAGIARNIDENCFEHLLVTGYCEKDEIDYLETRDFSFPLVRIEGLGRSLNLKSDLLAFFQIRSKIKNFRPDIIHTHTAKAGLLGRLASLSVKDNAFRIHTFHGHLLSGYFSSLRTSLVITVERLLSLFTDQLVGVGQQVVDDLVRAKIGKPQKFIVINPGLEIQTTKDRVRVREQLGISEDTFLISWVGRFASIKSPERVLAIARFLKRSKKSIKIIMVGGGSLLESIKEQSQSEDLPILFLGWRNDPENLIAASDLLLMTSKNEGTPISAIQAQILGIPVLTTDVGAVREIVADQETGFVRAYDPILFSNLIFLLSADNTMWLKQSSQAKSQSKSRFSVNRLVRDHELLYQKLIMRRQSS